MVERRSFSTGQLFGVKVRDYSVRTGVKVACVGSFNFNLRRFRISFISSEGVGQGYQSLRFETREQAEQWIRDNQLYYGYREDEMSVMNTVGTNEYQKVPVINSSVPAWVNVIKFDRYTSASALRKLREACPEYFEENAPGPGGETHYRGFRF